MEGETEAEFHLPKRSIKRIAGHGTERETEEKSQHDVKGLLFRGKGGERTELRRENQEGVVRDRQCKRKTFGRINRMRERK